MAKNSQAASAESDIRLSQMQPDPALKRLERLVGTWDLKGRTLDSREDNISGRTTFEWLPGGFFLEVRSELEFHGVKIHSLEVIGYDPSTKVFAATVYSNMDGGPTSYYWDVQADTVTHWTEGSKYTGTFSKDGRTLSGGWRPEEGKQEIEGTAYDAIMTRVK